MAGNRRSNLSAGRKSINASRVIELRAKGLTHAKIGIQLADEEGRAVRYQPTAVAGVLRRERRRAEAYAEYLQAETAETAAGAVEVLHGRR